MFLLFLRNVAYVATIEKANGLLNSFIEEGRIEEVGMLVVDEAHMIGEGGGRGALLEGIITKLNYRASEYCYVSIVLSAHCVVYFSKHAYKTSLHVGSFVFLALHLKVY